MSHMGESCHTQAFREGKFKCLVATDVAARGLDIPEIDLVIMCHPTKDPDTYVHRAGRTGRYVSIHIWDVTPSYPGHDSVIYMT